jgi:hypothetical protein
MPKWSEFVSWMFFGLMAFYGYGVTSNMSELNKNIGELNKNMAVVVFQVTDLYGRVGRLEEKQK